MFRALLLATTVAVPQSSAIDLSVGPVSLSTGSQRPQPQSSTPVSSAVDSVEQDVSAATNAVTSTVTSALGGASQDVQAATGGTATGTLQTVTGTAGRTLATATDTGTRTLGTLTGTGARTLSAIGDPAASLARTSTSRAAATAAPARTSPTATSAKRRPARTAAPPKPKATAARAPSGAPPALTLPAASDRLTALLAMTDQCTLSGLDLDMLVNDRRIVIVPITRILDRSGLAQFETTLLSNPPGRTEAVAAVQENAKLRAVLARAQYDEQQVVALTVGANGTTYVFVDGEPGAEQLAYLPNPPAVPVAHEACPAPDLEAPRQAEADRVEVASLGKAPLTRTNLLTPAPSAVMSELSVTPTPEVPRPASADAEADQAPLAPATDLVAVSDLLDNIARLDALLVALSAPEQGPVETHSEDEPAPGDLGRLVAASHALAEEASRVASLNLGGNVASLTPGGAVPGVLESDGPPPELGEPVAAPLALAGLRFDANADPFLAPIDSVRVASADPDVTEPAVCTATDGLPSMSTDLAAQFGVARSVQLVPLGDCAPPELAENQMRDLLWADARVRSLLMASGHGEGDIVGGRMSPGQVLSVYVAQPEG